MPDPSEVPTAAGPPAVPGDGGVIARVRRRTTAVAGAVAGLTAVALLTGATWPGWAAESLTATVVGVLGTVIGALLAGWLGLRARRWDRLERIDRRDRSAPATLGAPVPLHPVRAGQPIKRRLPAVVLPVRAGIAGLAGGEALIVHARRDRLQLTSADPVDVVADHDRGPYLLIRRTDGAVFAAERGIFTAI